MILVIQICFFRNCLLSSKYFKPIMFMKTTLRAFLALSVIFLLAFIQPANATIRTFQFSGTTIGFDGSTAGLAMSATLVYDDASTPVSSGNGYATYNIISFSITVGGSTSTINSGTITIEIPPAYSGSALSVSANEGQYQLTMEAPSQIFSTTALPGSLSLSGFSTNSTYIGFLNLSTGYYADYAPISAITQIFTNSIATDPSGTITGPLCAGSVISVPFSTTGTYNADNVFSAYLSNSSGVFDYTQPIIGSVTSTTSGTISATIPAGTAYATGYLINVVSSDPATTGTPNASGFTINTLPVPSLSQTAKGAVCPGTIVTYSTDAGQSNYLWGVSGFAGTDYNITGGGSGSDFITLQLLTASSQPVTVNYTNAGGCIATSPSSISTTVNLAPNVSVVSPVAVCAPATVDLTATAVTAGSDAGLTYTYFNDQAATSPVTTPTAVGNGGYYIVGTNSSTGCSSSPQSVTVTVNPLPTVTFPGTLTTQCAGNTSYTLTGGLPSGGIYTGTGVSGTNFDAAIAGVGANQLITYSYTDQNSCTNSATNTISVNPLPTLATVTQAAPVCDGSQATINLTGLMVSTSQTISYSIGSGATVTVVVLSDGNANASFPVTLSYANDYGLSLTISGISVTSGGTTCSSGPLTSNNSTPLEVSALPSANISTSSMVTAISSGNIASVDNAGTGAVYSWTISNGNITAGAGTNSITYKAGASGNVSLSVSVTGPPPTNCASVASGTLLVPITALPCPNPAIKTPWFVCASSASNKAAVAEPVQGNTYAWTISNGTIVGSATASSISYNAGAAGLVILSVKVTNASGGCTVSSGKYFILISPLPSAIIIAPASTCASSSNNIAFVPWAGPGATYAWTATNGTITGGSGTDVIAFKAPASGTVTLSATVTNISGCRSSSAGKSIVIVHAPVTPTFASIPILCKSAKAPKLPTESLNGIPGTWKPSTISTASTGTIKYVFTPASSDCATSVTVPVTVQTCKQAADVTSEQVISADTSSDSSPDVQGRIASIFPNPSVSGFTLSLKSSKKEAVEIVVMDVMGHALYHTRGEATGTYQFGGNFIKGMYFIQILYADKSKVLKAIRQ
jgi:PKD-like domain